MTPYFIPLELDKFQVCSHTGCGYDATSQHKCVMEDGTVYYASSCSRRGHPKRVKEALQRLKEGMDVRSLHRAKLLNTEELFIQPAGKDQKCKWEQWEEHLLHPESEAPPPILAPQASRRRRAGNSRVFDVSRQWCWEYHPGFWRDADNKKVRLQALPLAQLVASVRGIMKTNFKRAGSRLAWTKELTDIRVAYTYPEGAFDVEKAEASRKLEEFQEEAQRRELI